MFVYNKSMWKNLLSILTILALTQFVTTVFIPLSGRAPRCMIVYSVGESQTVKLDINFPPLPDIQEGEYFAISWKNTETDQKSEETTLGGRYRRQLSLTQNVIYDLCIRVETIRDYGILHVEYSAHNLFAVNQAEVKVPENLLKSSDITSSFLNAESIQKNLDAFIKIQDGKATTHAELFRVTGNISEKLVQISIIELVVIIGAGVYQFWALWKYLKNKNYI